MTFEILVQHKFDPVADNFSSRVFYPIEVRTGNINEKAIKIGRTGSLAGEDGFQITLVTLSRIHLVSCYCNPGIQRGSTSWN